jgi:hypothetical protein
MTESVGAARERESVAVMTLDVSLSLLDLPHYLF